MLVLMSPIDGNESLARRLGISPRNVVMNPEVEIPQQRKVRPSQLRAGNCIEAEEPLIAFGERNWN